VFKVLGWEAAPGSGECDINVGRPEVVRDSYRAQRKTDWEACRSMCRDKLPVVVIAAAGRARRFHGEQKVLAEVGGIPAVCRVANACEQALGPHRQLVVIGYEGARVHAALGDAPHREFVWQQPQLGTGHALAVALERLDPDVSAALYFFCGDKPLLTAQTIKRLRTSFLESGAAMAFLAGEVHSDPRENRQGRVLQAHSGASHAEVLAIVERAAIDALADGQTMRFRSLSGSELEFTREQLLAVKEVNVSAYAWQLGAVRAHITELRPHEGNGEYFITDLVEILRRHNLLVQAFPMVSHDEGIGIDTRAGAEEANSVWARRERQTKGQSTMALAAGAGMSQWEGICCSGLLRMLDEDGPQLRLALSKAYGTHDQGLLQERRQACLQAVRRFLDSCGDRPARIFRAPGRIALNPHCEHQGAWVPYGTHRRELLVVVAARHDDQFILTNVDTSYEQGISFRLQEEIALAPQAWRSGWTDYIQHPQVVARREALADPKERCRGRTSTVNFVKAAALRLAREAAPARCRGAHFVINGNIPIGVGQSSSSAVVVSIALALNDLWDLCLPPPALASICGEAEWYVGTRGGAGDHAGMLLGSSSGLVGICFEPPVKVRDTCRLRLPPEYQIIIANSGHKAIKNNEERLQFNAGIFAYRFSLVYLQEALRAQARELGLAPDQQEVRFLAGINVERYPLDTIYRLLRAVPRDVSPQELEQRYPDRYEQAALSCFGRADPELLPSIPLRGAAMYGLGRVDRGLAMHDICARGDEAAMREFGRLMYITHDGDRVSRYDPNQQRCLLWTENLESVADHRIDSLIEASACGGPAWERAELRYQSGFYGASIPELDRMVDLVKPLPDVLGAGLMGAGGGGCILILARAGEEAMSRVTEVLEQGYYRPLGKPVMIEPWRPTAPAGELVFTAGAVAHATPELDEEPYQGVEAS